MENRKRHFTYACVFAVLFIVIISGCGKSQPLLSNPSTAAPLGSRSFDMGFLPLPPQPLNTEHWLETFDLLKENADIVLEHGGMTQDEWHLFSQAVSEEKTHSIESANFVIGMAQKQGLKVLRTIDVFDDQDAIGNLPPDFSQSFSDQKVRTAFKNFVTRHARYKPAYLALFAEVNGYLTKHPEETEHIVSLVQESRELVKQVSPDTQVTVTFQYEVLNGLLDGKSQWETLDALEPELDAVAFTTYPSPYMTLDKIPEDYYSRIREHTQKPVLFAESGWPTAGESRWHGSPESQKEFLMKFVALTEDLPPKVWIYWFLHDWPGPGYPPFFQTMGLRTADGQPKPAWETWQHIQALPKD